MLPAIPGISSGELAKFKISVMDFTGQQSDKLHRNLFVLQEGKGKTFEAMFNPNSFGQDLKLETTVHSAPGKESNTRIFNRLGPQSYSFEFLLDGTGASAPTIPGGVGLALPGAEAIFKPKLVKEMVNDFMQVCYKIEPSTHKPNYVLLSWGLLDDVCLLESASVKYTLFRPDGEPLRARITANFNKVTPETEKVESADLTHIRAVSEGNNLPLMSANIYDKPGYYIQVAQANKLKNFRRLRTGRNLNFPPLRNVSE